MSLNRNIGARRSKKRKVNNGDNSNSSSLFVCDSDDEFEFVRDYQQCNVVKKLSKFWELFRSLLE